MQVHGPGRLIIFDLDGTLFHLQVEWDSLKSHCERTYLTGSGLSFGEAMGGRHRPELAEMYARVKAAELAGIRAGQFATQAEAILKRLAKRYRLAVVTRNAREVAQRVLARTELVDPLIVGREDVTCPKPDPQGLQSAMRYFEIAPSETVMVGDTLHDVQAAKAAGVPCVIVKNPRLRFVPEGAQRYVENLSELPDCVKDLESP